MTQLSSPPSLTKKELLEMPLDREDIILILLEANERLLGKSYLSGITRLEKLLFLLVNETDFEGIGHFFIFKAHNFGPFSKEVYEAVEFLESCEMLEIKEKAYPSYFANVEEVELLSEISDLDLADDQESYITEKLFFLTEQGRKLAKILKEAVAARRPQDIESVDKIILRYGNLPLNQLIRYVYKRYPKMTEKSIHPEAKQISA